ncbi:MULTISPECIES: AfsR/SARP family transcriptional regulator [unclassified Frankia]|uniref:AfsR/SARP family transcriptional regulator n=1 Tax=unclassified Frankia TaxID=2632575 RepID=UPI002AD2C2EA|nr:MULTISPECIES: BTAD domain-containing putative transcriptional regulator [unclassified Frankia]
MEFRVLGSLEMVRDATHVPIGGPQRRLLLAALLSEANRPIPDRDLLRAMQGDGGWHEEHRREHLHRLRVHILGLRRVLGQSNGQPLARDAGGYVLQVGADELDELVFLRLVEQARRLRDSKDVASAADRVDEALALWRGEPLADLERRPFVERYAARLGELRLHAEKERAAAYLAAGRHGPLVPILRRLLVENPADERLQLDLSLALYRDGRREDAAAVCLDALRRSRDRGIEPTAMRERQRAILADEPSLRWAAPAEQVRLGAVPRHPVPSQLPAGTRNFTGREKEVADLLALFEAEDAGAGVIVSAIAGQAGVGKTALAIHVAHQLRGRFPDGFLYTNLQATPDSPAEPSTVLVSFLLGLGVSREHIGDDPQVRAALYRSTLDGKRLLVVLDNATDAEQVRPLLPGAASCGVIITSRRALSSLDADHFVLDVLDSDPAVALLAKVARGERVAAELDEARTIVALCGFLPLAVRIAGARLAQRPDAKLRSLREELQVARLNVLRVGDLEVRASVDLSYRGLPAATRRAFRLLSVLETEDVSPLAAAALLDQNVQQAAELLEELAVGHLIERRAGNGDEPRYRFHDLLLLFARERLAQEDCPADRCAALERVLEMYLACAQDAASRLHAGSRTIVPRRSPPRWQPGEDGVIEAAARSPIQWFDRESKSVVALVEQAGAEGFDEMTWLLSAAIVDFLEIGSHWSFWHRTHEAALAATLRQRSREAEANMRRHLGQLRRLQGDRAGARTLFEASLALFVATSWPIGEAAARRNLGELDIEDGRIGEAIDHLRISRDLCRDFGMTFGVARALETLGRAYLAADRPAESLSCLEAAVGYCEMTSNQLAVERARMALGSAFLRTGRVDDAIGLLGAAERFFQAEGHLPLRAEALLLLGDAHSRGGRDAEAFACYDACLSIFQERGDMLNEARTLARRGRLHYWRDDDLQARASWRQALALFNDHEGTEESEVRDWLAHGPGDRLEPATERVLDHFDHDGFIRRVAASEYVVRILSTWIELLEDRLRDSFLAAVRHALDRGALVQIMLLDPESPAAVQRSREIGTLHDVCGLVRENLHRLRIFIDGLAAADRERIAVRVYAAASTVAYYRCDARALVATFPLGDSSSRTTHYEVPVDSTFAQFVEQRFAELWTSGSRPLEF